MTCNGYWNIFKIIVNNLLKTLSAAGSPETTMEKGKKKITSEGESCNIKINFTPNR